MGLQGIGSQEKGAAVRQLDMGDLKLRALSADNCEVLAPVELERFAGAESQRDEGAAPRRLLLALSVSPPIPGKSRNPVVGTGKPERHQIGVHLLQRLPLFAWLPGIGLQPARQLLGKRVKLARPFRRRELRLHRVRSKMLRHRIARQSRAPRDLADRQLLSQVHTANDVQKSHVDHSATPAARRFGGRFTWLNSQWKLRAYPAQCMPPAGAVFL